MTQAGGGSRETATDPVVVRPADLREPAVQDLVAALLDDLRTRYGSPDTSPPPTAEEFAPPAGRFVVAELGGRPVACGGIRPYPGGGAEIKRMFVGPTARGRGVGRAILAALEDAAREAGYAELRLETGTAQPEAIALYASAGFVAIEPYGHYAASPETRCFGKAL